jgi:hypothetical protein
MNLDKKQIAYIAIGALAGLIIYSSLKPTSLVEVHSENVNAEGFNHEILPKGLKPPYRLAEGEELPKTSVPTKNFNSLLGSNVRF